MAELRMGSGILGGSWAGLLFPLRCHTIYGAFAYLAPPRWLSGFDVHLPRNAPRNPRCPHGTLRGGKMAETRLESGILGIDGPVFGFLLSPPRMRGFRVFTATGFGVGF